MTISYTEHNTLIEIGTNLLISNLYFHEFWGTDFIMERKQ